MPIKRISIYITFYLIILFLLTCNQSQEKLSVSLAGKWRFQADANDRGIQEKWYATTLKEKIQLPGSMIEQGKGEELSLKTQWTGSIYDSSWYFDPAMEKYRQPGNLKFPFWLTPKKHYIGPAWYQRNVEIPGGWKNKRITVYLERPHWETTIWVDSSLAGMQNSLSVPHEYDCTELLTPGRHTITIRLDNRIKDINPGPDSHSLTDHTQGNWNGIAGDMFLRAGSPVYIKNIQLYPDIQDTAVKVHMHIRNETEKIVTFTIQLLVKSLNPSHTNTFKTISKSMTIIGDQAFVLMHYPMGEDMQLWDEFNPNLYQMRIDVSYTDDHHDVHYVQFGMRDFTAREKHFEINGRPVFLRGTVECCVFPRTGYPPTDVPSWKRILNISKNHGLNHMRFHSWCPPKAAFVAADQVGFYLQIEGPSWANHGTSIGDGNPIDEYLYQETQRILDAYGNHPSFCMMAYGNEPAGENQVEYLGKYINHFKAKDNRRLYTGASIGMSWPLIPESEFIVRSGPRGLPWDKQPQSQFDYRDKIQDIEVPYVVHEMGQYCVFPNFQEIKKYKGVYRAKNLELFQENLQDHHMDDLAPQFLMASGKLQSLCYKSEIEAALRTPGLAGTQLLSLNDFPGQGSAIVGVLDVFWDEKGYIRAEEFKRFFGATVPLARLPKFVFKNNETLHADIEVAHFGQHPLEKITPTWEIRDSEKILYQGSFKNLTIPINNCVPLGSIDVPLSDISRAKKLNLSVRIGDAVNQWDFWVYPNTLPPVFSTEIHFFDALDDRIEEILNQGGNVFIHAAGNVENGKDVIQYLRPVFWNTSWFQMHPPHTLGILCDPNHPAFHDFPTEYHSNLQWWEILHGQQVMNLENFPPEFKPLIQSIDTWFLNRRLGILFEVRVGKGKLMVCSADLMTDLDHRPAARQLLYSLAEYMASDQFDPAYTVDISVIRELFEKKDRPGIHFYTKSSTDDLKPKVN